MSPERMNWWTGVEWITGMFLSAVWTLLTAPIHCRAYDVMLHFSKSVLLKKLIPSWTAGGWVHFEQMFLWVTFSLCSVMGNDSIINYTLIFQTHRTRFVRFFVKIYICICSFSRRFYPQRHTTEGKQVIYHKAAENISNGASVDFKSKSEKH